MLELSIRLAALERKVDELLTADRYMTAKEAAEYLCYSYDHIRRLVSTGVLPHYSPSNGKVLFKKSELDAWVAESRVSGASERDTQSSSQSQRKS